MASESENSFEFMEQLKVEERPFEFMDNLIETSRGYSRPAIAINNVKRRKVNKDMILLDKPAPTKQTGTDSSSTPFGEEDEKKDHIGELRSAMTMLHPREWYATATTSEGKYITVVAPRFALRNGWTIKTFKTKDRELKKSNKNYTDFLSHKYKIKKYSTSTITLGETFGRGLCFAEQVASRNEKMKWMLSIAPLEEGEIDYETVVDSNGEIVLDEKTGKPKTTEKVKYYHPKVKRGTGQVILDIKPEDGVLFIAEPDPYGNREQGVPQLLGAYRSIQRVENIEDSSARMYKNRGLGLGHMTIEGAAPEDCDEYAEKYGNPDEFTMMFTDERFKLNVHEGIKNGYNLSQTLATFKEGISQATGYPQSSFRGNSEGQQSTSETSSDTRETVLQTIQERYEEFILKVYYMLDEKEEKKGLENKQLYLEWEHTIKMDKQKEMNVKSTVAGFINSVGALFTVNQARELLGQPPEEDEEKGKMIYAEYKMQFAPLDPFGQEPKEPGEKPGEMKPGIPTPPKYEARELNNQLNKKDTLIRLFKSGITLNKGLNILRAISEDGKAIDRTVASQLYQKVKDGKI